MFFRQYFAYVVIFMACLISGCATSSSAKIGNSVAFRIKSASVEWDARSPIKLWFSKNDQESANERAAKILKASHDNLSKEIMRRLQMVGVNEGPEVLLKIVPTNVYSTDSSMNFGLDVVVSLYTNKRAVWTSTIKSYVPKWKDESAVVDILSNEIESELKSAGYIN